MTSSPVKLGGLGLFLGMLAAAPPAMAQSIGGQSCAAANELFEGAAETVLVVSCKGAGAILGSVDGYELFQLPGLAAAVVVTERDTSRRAWLIIHQDDGPLQVEEITNTIARLAGRGARADIDGIELDFGQGGAGRLVGAIRSASRNTEGGGEVAIDFSELITRSRQVRSSKVLGGSE